MFAGKLCGRSGLRIVGLELHLAEVRRTVRGGLHAADVLGHNVISLILDQRNNRALLSEKLLSLVEQSGTLSVVLLDCPSLSDQLVVLLVVEAGNVRSLNDLAILGDLVAIRGVAQGSKLDLVARELKGEGARIEKGSVLDMVIS